MIYRLLVAAALLSIPAAATAQSFQCAVPQGPLSVPPVETGRERKTPVTGYTLAVSWSPEYCRTRTRSKADARQCSGTGGRFGMILHGLWPEGRDTSPQWCSVRRNVHPDDLRGSLCITPSERLLAHEWARHGSCVVPSPASYFKIERILWRSLRWPDFDRLSRQDPSAGDVRRAFVEANPAWKPEQVGVQVNARGWLEGLRLCYGKDYMPRRCDRARAGAADTKPLKIWRGL